MEARCHGENMGFFEASGIMVEVSELLEEKVAMLRRLTKEYEVNLAIGFAGTIRMPPPSISGWQKPNPPCIRKKVHTIKQRG